ncbi:MAG TPA: MBL fold metallo-hydrolase [Spirochaetota bacterium]|nr:MBL fold metallo-hydrolase [Spirochaetota bacterium]HSA13513.1 MBL fold metallo-hydrolase [Spirochaetota bacterium]
MQIEFVGGARTVTGSSFIVKDKDFTIMVDCGMFQGKRELKARNHLNLIYAPKKIDALLLTHAHIDHSGLVPKLVKEGFFSNIYATEATADLCSVMLPDSAHIQEMDTDWVNRRNRRLGRDVSDALYTVEDAENSLKNFVPVSYDKVIQIHPRIQVRFRDAGHILGSAFIEMWIDEDGKKTKIVFSGDIGQKGQAIIRNPETVDEADILLIESTYGDREHRDRQATYDELRQIILDARNKNGNIVIPAFAIERTQEIIYTLSKLMKSGEIPQIPVYIDSPLAISATEIFKKNEQCFDDEMRRILLSGDSPLDFPSLKFVRSSEESKALNDTAKGSIIISASGMCTAGRIKYHLMNNLYKPGSSVVFVGYQAEGTLGRRLVDGAKQVRVYGQDVHVNAKIHTLGGFSAHADRKGLLDWMGTIKNPKLKVFVVHGEEDSSLKLSEAIQKEHGHAAYVPRWGEIIDVASMRSSIAPYGAADTFNAVDGEIGGLEETIRVLVNKYRKARDENRRIDMKQLQEDINDAREMLSMIIDEL